jgi:hypothetical protein
MAGKYSGVQARIKEENPSAELVFCSAHSLNLVGSYASKCCLDAVSFFGFLQSLYNFFSLPTQRWGLLVSVITGTVVKSLSITRWSVRSDATRALRENYAEICSALMEMLDKENQTQATRIQSSSLHSKMKQFETALLCILLDSILHRFNAASQSLQATHIELETCVALYDQFGVLRRFNSRKI